MFAFVLRWLDVTPTSRVIARCTQDIQSGVSELPVLRRVKMLIWLVVDMMVPNALAYLCTHPASAPR